MKRFLYIPLVPIFSIFGASFPEKLSSAAEKELLERYSAGDMDAKNRLIEHNLRLVAHICKKYSSSSADSEDLISIGTIGLIKGLSSYKPEKGTKLATYTARCIENAIIRKCLIKNSPRKYYREIPIIFHFRNLYILPLYYHFRSGLQAYHSCSPSDARLRI